ncbi:MAG TPA: STAS domain-containing protein [Aldersonia sp.]
MTSSTPDDPRGTARAIRAEGAAVQVDRLDSAVVLNVSGEIDIVSAPLVQEAAERVLDDSPTTLIMNLSDVTFLASAGLAMLVLCHQMCGEQTRFGVVANTRATSRPIELTGLDSEMSVHSSLDAALAD